MLVVIRTQELAGIDVVSDGELSRFDVDHPETNGMIDYFVGSLDGVRTRLTRPELERAASDPGLRYRRAPAGIVVDRIGPGVLNLPEAARPLRELATARTKFAVTSPYMLAKVLLDDHYGAMAELTMALADVLSDQVAGVEADVIQVDEANVTGHPEDAELAAAAINRVLAGARGERAVHLCYGNYGGQSVQAGSYVRLLGFMNALEADHLVLELARRDRQDLEALREVDQRIGIGIGVIDIKDNQVETAEDVARAIEDAERVLGDGRVRYVHPDCGFWMLQRSVADAKLHALVRGRDLYEGRS
jgi:5-methyltetrahydropteroyltriglutamate--homocysteine methyltransferase